LTKCIRTAEWEQRRNLLPVIVDVNALLKLGTIMGAQTASTGSKVGAANLN